MHPLRFHPILRRYLWGGQRLGTVLGKPVGQDARCAESWEVCDRPADQSVVVAGPLAGSALGDLVRQHGPALLGRHHPQPRFPLLFKFLDAREHLSIQVHPDDAGAARLDPPDLGKTEAWVVLAAEPGALIYAGLKRGTDRALLARELNRGTSELCLCKYEPRPGDCVFLPAGTPHAIGAGLLVAEIQQASDTTFRLHDWGRVGPDGQPRALHIEQGLDAIDFDRQIPLPLPPQSTEQPHVERLVACEKFVLERRTLSADDAIGGDDRCHIVAVLSGTVRVAGDPAEGPLPEGGTVLLPAACGAVTLSPGGTAVVLDAYLP
jgi:mannose-6-phosphate isomerase